MREFELLFGRLAGRGFLFHLFEMQLLALAAGGNLESEQPGAGQRRENQDVLRHGHGPEEVVGIEQIRQQRAHRRRAENLPSPPDRPYQEHGNQVEKAEGDGRIHPPIHQGDRGDYPRREDYPRLSL